MPIQRSMNFSKWPKTFLSDLKPLSNINYKYSSEFRQQIWFPKFKMQNVSFQFLRDFSILRKVISLWVWGLYVHSVTSPISTRIIFNSPISVIRVSNLEKPLNSKVMESTQEFQMACKGNNYCSADHTSKWSQHTIIVRNYVIYCCAFKHLIILMSTRRG